MRIVGPQAVHAYIFVDRKAMEFIMLCKKCGAQIDDNAKECAFCGENFDQGTDVAKDDFTEEAAVAAVTNERSTHEIFEENERKRRQQNEAVVDEKMQQLNEINERRELKKKREKRNKILLIIILCLIIAAIAGGGAYYLKTASERDEVVTVTPTPIPTPQATPTPTPEATEEAERAEQAQNTNQGQGTTSPQGGVTGPVKVTTTRTPITTAAPAKTAAPVKTAAPLESANSASRKGTNAKTYLTPQKQSGVVSDAIVSKLAIGGQVINDGTTKGPVMTFAMDGVTYYAYVSEGSWTEFINGKYMTVSATATGEKYKGNTIYDISKLVYYVADDYVIADSGVRLLTEAELKEYSKSQLALARNEIFARHGRSFTTKEYADFFAAKSWYKISDNYDYEAESSNINDIERKNVDLIKKVELSK